VKTLLLWVWAGRLINQHSDCNSPVVEAFFGDIDLRLKFCVGSVIIGDTSGVEQCIVGEECSFAIRMGRHFVDVKTWVDQVQDMSIGNWYTPARILREVDFFPSILIWKYISKKRLFISSSNCNPNV